MLSLRFRSNPSEKESRSNDYVTSYCSFFVFLRFCPFPAEPSLPAQHHRFGLEVQTLHVPGSGAGNYTHKQERGPKPKGARQPVLSLTGFTTGSGVKYGPSFTNGVTVASTMGPAVCTPHKMFGTHTPRPTNIIFNDLCPSSHDSRMFLSLRVDLFIITTVGHKRRVVL